MPVKPTAAEEDHTALAVIANDVRYIKRCLGWGSMVFTSLGIALFTAAAHELHQAEQLRAEGLRQVTMAVQEIAQQVERNSKEIRGR